MRRRGMNGRTFSPNPRKRRRSHHHHHHLLSPFANAHNASDSLELRFKPTTMYRLSNAGNWYMYKVTFDQEAQTTRSGVRWEEYHWLLWPQLNDNVLHSNTLPSPLPQLFFYGGGGGQLIHMTSVSHNLKTVARAQSATRVVMQINRLQIKQGPRDLTAHWLPIY